MRVIKHRNRCEFKSLEVLKTQLEKCPEEPALSWLCPVCGLGTDSSNLSFSVIPVLPPAGRGTKSPQTSPGEVWQSVTSFFSVRDRGILLFKYWPGGGSGSYPLVTGLTLETCVRPLPTSRKNLLFT